MTGNICFSIFFGQSCESVVAIVAALFMTQVPTSAIDDANLGLDMRIGYTLSDDV